MTAHIASFRFTPSSAVLTPPARLLSQKLSAIKLLQTPRLHRSCRQAAAVQSSEVLVSHVPASTAKQQVRFCMLWAACFMHYVLLGSVQDPAMCPGRTSSTCKEGDSVCKYSLWAPAFCIWTLRLCCWHRVHPRSFSNMRSPVVFRASWTVFSLCQILRNDANSCSDMPRSCQLWMPPTELPPTV